jgi:hypothetical protein
MHAFGFFSADEELHDFAVYRMCADSLDVVDA